jgi:hypothetical protein
MVNGKRGFRRFRSYKVACARSRAYNVWNDATGRRTFSKVSPFCCGCSKRRKGRPRLSNGMCCVGDRKPLYEERRRSREWLRDVCLGRCSSEDDPLFSAC